MKKFFIIALSFGISSAAFSQIKMVSAGSSEKMVGEVKKFGTPIASIVYTVSGIDTACILSFNNLGSKEDDIKTVKFSGAGNTIEGLYSAFSSVFLPENKTNKDYKLEFNLGTTFMRVSTERAMGVTSARVATTEGYFFLTEKQLKKLFGKVDAPE